MSNFSLLAVSPIDGRYARQTESLREYFSEYALIKYRVRVEIEYFIALCQIPLPQLADFDASKFEALRDIYRNMTPEDAARMGVRDKQIVKLQVYTARPLIFEDVLVRVHKDYETFVHLDYDEANACGFQKGDLGRILS